QNSQSKRKTTGNRHVCKYPYCGWSFKRYEHLKRHMLVHTGERPHVCNYPGCGKSFSRSDNFAAHYRTHTRRAMMQRRMSTITSEYVPSDLQPDSVHNQSRRPSTSSKACGKVHVCQVPHCQRKFKRLEHLKRHMRTHTMERPFTCSIKGCNKSFSRSDNLSQHIKTHQRR
ncbi:hypothetical protein BGW37DRAFT_407886, partial [Umbelopsis sp. PMI_123]